MYEEPKIEILLFLQDDVLQTSDGWKDWGDDNVDPDGWV